MSSIRTSRLLMASLLAAASLATPAVAEAGIIVASSGPSAKDYPPGAKLPDDRRITLKAGDSVTILDDRGTRVLRGPETFTVGRGGAARRSSTFAALTRQRSSERVRTGAVRGPGDQGEIRSPNLWYVDVTKPGKVCLVDTDAVRVWRPVTDGPERYTITAADGSADAVLDFEKGSMLAVWDGTKVPVSDGARFAIRKEGTAASNELVFVVLPEQPETPEDLASTLIDNGCSVQLDLLAASLARG